jgi:RimJ/RimL family protein N-acetyltransferase
MTTTTDRQDLRRALDMDRRLLGAAAQRADDHPLGVALHNPALPRVWVQNQLHVLGPAGDIDDLIRILDELYGDLDHRRAVVEDEAEGERLAEGFADRGWLVSRTVYMALREPRDREPAAGRAREVDEATLQPIERRMIASEPHGKDPEVVEQLLRERAALHRAADSCHYVAGCEGDELVGTTTLYRSGELAQVEDVITAESHRGRGIARAMVSLAIDLAGDADLVWIAADAEDWPKELYFKLGFRPMGRTICFTLLGPAHPASRPG